MFFADLTMRLDLQQTYSMYLLLLLLLDNYYHLFNAFFINVSVE